MKLGDLVRVKNCSGFPEGHPFYDSCECFFCSTKSNRIGFVTSLATQNAFNVMFDTGMWRLDNFDVATGDVEVINESR